jgi:uncharacterized protein
MFPPLLCIISWQIISGCLSQTYIYIAANMKNILILLLLIFFAKLAFAHTDGVPVPELSGHVNDYAGIISAETRDKLERLLRQHEDSTSNQIVVLTIPSLEDQEIEDAANEIFNTWQLGQRDKNNGVLLLIALDDREMRIEVGYGLEAALTDAHCSRIIRNELTPRFKYKEYDEGVLAGVDAIRQAIQGAYSAEDPGFWETLMTHEGMGFPENLLAGALVMGMLLIFTYIAIVGKGIFSWFMFFFLLFFYFTFPFFVFGSIVGMLILIAYVGLFLWTRVWFKTVAGKAYLQKLAPATGRSGSGSGRSSSRSSSRSYSRSSYSGGGGRSGGGGSSGSW